MELVVCFRFRRNRCIVLGADWHRLQSWYVDLTVLPEQKRETFTRNLAHQGLSAIGSSPVVLLRVHGV